MKQIRNTAFFLFVLLSCAPVQALVTSLPSTFTGAYVNELVGATTFYANGITGQGAVMASIENQHIWNGHETLGHVTTYSHHADASGSYGQHNTFVGMIMGGRTSDPTRLYRTGIAPGAALQSGAFGLPGSGFSYTANSLATPYRDYFGSTDVINSSWYLFSNDGNIARFLDGLANQNPQTTFVPIAGNEGPNANTVTTPGSNYNSITVASLQNDGSNNYNAIANSSSRGPSSGRAVVDIAAPGTVLTAGGYLFSDPQPNYYWGNLNGTSFAAPIVTGAVALIDSASYNTPSLASNPGSRDARTVKAVLLNSADKIPGWNNGQTPHPNNHGGVRTTQSLDWASGAGALDLNRAYDQYLGAGTQDVPGELSGLLGPVDAIGWDFGIVPANAVNIYSIARPLLADSLFTVTLDWFRNTVAGSSTLDGTDLSLANLDLIVRDAVSGNVISESVSTVNVVEHLHFPIPVTALYQVEVRFTGMSFGTAASEEYGLAWYGTAVPEPGSALLLALSCLGLGGLRRVRQ
jgi:hypothetical protein